MTSKMLSFWEKRSETSDTDASSTVPPLDIPSPPSTLNGRLSPPLSAAPSSASDPVRDSPRDKVAAFWEAKGSTQVALPTARSAVRFDSENLEPAQNVRNITSPLKRRQSVAPVPPKMPATIEERMSRTSSLAHQDDSSIPRNNSLGLSSIDVDVTSVETPTHSSDRGTPGMHSVNMSFARLEDLEEEFVVPSITIDRADLDLAEVRTGLQATRDRLRALQERFEDLRASVETVH